MSKKTIYTVFSDKTSLFLSMVDYLFDTIKESERAILENEALSTVEKIRAILGVMPDSYKDINFAKLYLLKEKYPEIYTRVEQRLEGGWEMTMGLLEQGIKEGCIRPVNLSIFKLMMEAALEQFFQRDNFSQQWTFLYGRVKRSGWHFTGRNREKGIERGKVMEDKSKIIYGNAIGRKAYRNAIHSKKKFIKKLEPVALLLYHKM